MCRSPGSTPPPWRRGEASRTEMYHWRMGENSGYECARHRTSSSASLSRSPPFFTRAVSFCAALVVAEADEDDDGDDEDSVGG